MRVTGATTKLNRLIASESQLVQRFGDKRARLIMRRLSVLRAAPALSDVPVTPPERRHELTGRRKGELAVNVDEKLRIVFVPDHDPIPKKPDGGLDVAQVTAVTIQIIEDYH